MLYHVHLSRLHALSFSALLGASLLTCQGCAGSKQRLLLLIGTALLCIMKQQMQAELDGWQTMIGLCAVVLTGPV